MLLKLFFLCCFSIVCGTSYQESCVCPQSSVLSVTTTIPWLLVGLILYLFYYHLMHSCGVNSAKKTIKDASAKARRRAAVTTKTTPSSTSNAVQVLDVNNNTKMALLKEYYLPVKAEDFRGFMQIVTEFVIDYLRNTSNYEVTTDCKPGFIYSKFPMKMPQKSENFDTILNDIYEWIWPGTTHWQHPQFHGYFPGGVSYPDILAETIISSTGIAAFSWDASPSFTELEVVMVNWFGRAIGLPDDFLFMGKAAESPGGGALQFFLNFLAPTASDAVYVAVLAARYKKMREFVRLDDPDRFDKEAKILAKLVAYASVEAHTCIDKACNLAMVRLRSIPSSEDTFSLRGAALEHEVEKDRERGLIPFFIHATSGTTSICSFDNLEECSAVAKKYGMWMHVDAAYAGSALICPEFRYTMKGIGLADSLDINTHKFLLTSLIRCIGLSRRGKALKLWFLFRMYGLKHLQEYVRRLVRLTTRFTEHLKTDSRIELVGEQHLALVCFRVKHENPKVANEKTTLLCQFINRSRRLFITHASPRNIDIVRVSMNVERLTEADVDKSWKILEELLDDFFGTTVRKTDSFTRFFFHADRDFEVSPVATVDGTQRSMSQGKHSDVETDNE